jgi:hypothetical protein
METYPLEKLIWDDGDFEVMGWHDATIWAIHPDPDAHEFSLDLDYIFKWVDPGVGETYFKFWVAPATMVFENAHALKIVIDSPFGIEVADLHRGEPEPAPYVKLSERSYRFQLPAGTDKNHEIFNEGEISLRSTGFRMFVRRAPALLGDQHLSPAQRGGVGFQRGFSPA